MSITGTNVVAFFTSGSGFPASGLTPALTIRNVADTLIVATGSMSEVGDGWYKFSFDDYDCDNDYVITIDGGDSSLDSRYSFAGNESFVNDIWGTQRDLHTITGSQGEAQRDVYDIEVGSWRILSDGTMELTRSGSNEVIASFDLQDINGVDLTDPTSQDPFRRNRKD